MKKILFISILIMGIINFAFAKGEGETKVIKIGVAGPHSGDLAAYGIPTLEAAEIIAKKINDAGGINGSMIKLDITDDACDPAQATNVASKLVADGVVAVVGHICSGATISAMATYISAGIPVVSPSATNPDLTKSGQYSGFFRTIAPDDEQGVTQANFLLKKLQVKKVAVIHDQADYGKGLADSTKTNLENANVEVAIYEGIVAGAVDYSAIVSKIIGADVDAVVFGGYHPEGSKLIDQLKKKGYTKAFISGDGLKAEEFISLAGSAAEGVYASGSKDYSANQEYQDAEKRYKAEYNKDPGAFFYEGYAALTTIVAAIQAGNTTAADIQQYLLSGAQFDTSVGKISFDKKGDSVGTGFDVYQVKNGTFVSVK